jgi:hypothetical protein
MGAYLGVSVCCLASLAMAGGQESHDADLQKHLLLEIAESSSRLQEWGAQLEYRGVLTSIWKEPTGKLLSKDVRRVRLCRKGELILIESQILEPLSPEEGVSLGAINPRYLFLLRKKDLFASWVLYLYLSRSSDHYERVRKGQDDYLYSTNPSCYLWGKPLGELFQDSGFGIRHITVFSQSGQKCARVHFRYVLTAPSIGKRRMAEGKLVLINPGASWMMQSYDYRVKDDDGVRGQSRGEIRYGEKVAGYPAVVEYTRTEITPNIHHIHWRAERVIPCTLTEADFHLPAYGLPEIELASTAPSRRHLFHVFALLTLVTMIMILIWRRHRRKQMVNLEQGAS